jgi:hypothetical protein
MQAHIEKMVTEVERFWRVLKTRRDNGQDDRFWRSPGIVFRSKQSAEQLSLCDAQGRLTSFANDILAFESWITAQQFVEHAYLKMDEERQRRNALRIARLLESKRGFAPLQVIPFAEWKWPWLYVSKILYEKPKIYYDGDGDPCVSFPAVFPNVKRHYSNWRQMINIGWINELGEVREEIVAALKERERRLLETGGLPDKKNSSLPEIDECY